MSGLPANATARLLTAAASVNATLVRSTPVCLQRIVGYNAAAAGRWLKLYDVSALPDQTVTPRKSYYLPPSQGFAFDVDDYFATGLGYRLTVGSADNDVAAPTAGDVIGLNLDYR